MSNSNELYRAVSFGYKPIFATDTEGKALEKLYAEARNVLETYLSDDMSDYQKVAAIYDWIVNVVDYDYAVAELGGTDRPSTTRFISKAFSTITERFATESPKPLRCCAEWKA